MFENIGGTIKKLAVVFFAIGAICSFVLGLVGAEETNGFSILIGLLGIPVAWIGSCILYGFGEIIDKLCAIEKNTRGIKRICDCESKPETHEEEKETQLLK